MIHHIKIEFHMKHYQEVMDGIIKVDNLNNMPRHEWLKTLGTHVNIIGGSESVEEGDVL